VPSPAPLPRAPASPLQPPPVPDEPVRALPSLSTSLPLQLTRFVGRTAELEGLEFLLRSHLPPENGQGVSLFACRLATITGPGGAGKTRLAIEVAGRSARVFEGRVWFVPLADLTDPALLPFALANALKLPSVSGDDPLEQVVSFLNARDTYLPS